LLSNLLCKMWKASSAFVLAVPLPANSSLIFTVIACPPVPWLPFLFS
jgi:hypothetical protein